jgi:ribonuclease-3
VNLLKKERSGAEMSPHSLEISLGHRFSEPALLTQALTHRSFGVPHNERLEFLGDGVLNFAIASLIYRHHPDMPEGELSRLRANLVNQASLADIATTLGLGKLLRLGEGECKTGGAGRPSILADALEALLGAIFLDAGFDKAEATVRLLFALRLESANEGRPSKDAKTTLQEWLQARRLPLPEYVVIKIEGEAHRQKFHVRCDIASQGVTAVGAGHSRRTAEQDAATRAFTQITEQSTGNTT